MFLVISDIGTPTQRALACFVHLKDAIAMRDEHIAILEAELPGSHTFCIRLASDAIDPTVPPTSPDNPWPLHMAPEIAKKRDSAAWAVTRTYLEDDPW